MTFRTSASILQPAEPIKSGDDTTLPQPNQSSAKQLSVVGLFAGIGGLEQGFRQAGHKSLMLCEADATARDVLRLRFGKSKLTNDIVELKTLPICDVVTAGFPCQDLSQVGRRHGIEGPNSSLVGKVFELLRGAKHTPSWLILENVPFMLKLHQGRAIKTLVDTLEAMGWAWAYRTIDTRAFGLPQRRRRIILLASPIYDPRPALFAQNVGIPKTSRSNHACGFYWTEGNTGLGWAENAIPPLKGGSSIHIPSPPAIWFPGRRAILTPDIRDTERLQGFEADWTLGASQETQDQRKRWRLVGNAVSVPVAKWVASRLATTDEYSSEFAADLNPNTWPDAAWGVNGRRAKCEVSSWPVQKPYMHLASFFQYPLVALSEKATAGFLYRLERSGLHYLPEFRDDLRYHLNTYGGAKKHSNRKVGKSAHGSNASARQSKRKKH